MSDDTAVSAARRAAELILQDEALTADLEDAEADALLRWALARAERIAAARLERGEPADGEAVLEAIRPLRRVMRAVNDLAASRTRMPAAEFMARLLALLDAACQLERLPSGETTAPAPATEPPLEP